MLIATVAHPLAQYTTAIAVLGLLVSLVVGIYSAWSSRKAARETAELANWPAMVAALQAEVDRLNAQVIVLEGKHRRLEETEGGPGRSS